MADYARFRDPLLPRSQVRGQNSTLGRSTLAHHAIINQELGRYYLCNCAKPIRGVNGFNKLGRRRRRDWRWADIYRCYGRRPDVENRW